MSGMKYLLASPRTEMVHKEFNREPPQGLLYLASVLEKAGHEVVIADLSRNKLASFSEPDFFGITSLTNTYNKAIRILSEAKKLWPGVRTIMGGPHVSFLPEEALNTGVVDHVVIGEGENAILNLDSEILKPEPPNINELPLPARHLIRGYSVAGVVINRGCPFKCAFCSRQKLFRKVRVRSAESIISELRQVSSLGYSYFNLYDNLNFSMDYAFTVVQAVHDSGINLPWGAELRADKLTNKLSKQLARTGCQGVAVGVESASPKVLASVNKTQDPRMVLKGIKHALYHGMAVQAYFIIGLPGETWDTFSETLSFVRQIRDLGVEFMDFFYATPYPGSDFWFRPEHYGISILHKNWDLYDTEHIIMETSTLTQDDIKQMMSEAQDLTRN